MCARARAGNCRADSNRTTSHDVAARVASERANADRARERRVRCRTRGSSNLARSRARRVKARAQDVAKRVRSIDARASVDAAKAGVDRAVRAVKSVDATAMARNAARAVRARVDVDVDASVVMWLAASAVGVAKAGASVGHGKRAPVLSMASRVVVRRTVVGTHEALMFVDRFLATFAKNLALRAAALARRARGRADASVSSLRSRRGERALEVKAVLVTVLMAFLVRLIRAVTTRKASSREVEVVLVTRRERRIGRRVALRYSRGVPGRGRVRDVAKGMYREGRVERNRR